MKKWYYSKTLWINSVAVIAIIVEYLLLKQVISPELHIVGLAIINIILRTVTNTPLSK